MRKIPQRTTSGTRVFNIENGSDALTLTFSSHALNALKVDIGTAFVSVARAGTEVGGILEGAIRKNGSAWEMTVRGITPFPIQYEYGLRYRLGSADLQRVRGLLGDGAVRGGFVGWYRSNTRREHDPDEADRKVTEDLFNGPSALFLCEASADGRIAVNCFVILPERTETVFSFDLGHFSLMAESKPREFAKVAPVTKIRELYGITPTRSHKSPALLPPDRGEGKIGRNLAIGAAALSIAGLGLFLRHRAPDAATSIAGSGSAHSAVRSAARSDTALGLTAEYQGNALFISWDRHAVPVASARYAIFTIADGVRTRVLHLSLHDLQTGSILYKPTSDEISLELDVMSNALDSASETIKIMGAATSNPAAFAPARTAAPAFKELVIEDGKRPSSVGKTQAGISGSLPPQLTPSGSHQRLSDAKQHVPETMKITGVPNPAGTPTAPAAANEGVEANRPSGMHQSESLAEPTSVFVPPPSPRDEPHGTIEDPNLSNRSSALVHPVLPLGNTFLPSPAAPEIAADAGSPSPALSKTAAQSAQNPVREFRPAIPIRSPQPAMPGGRAIPDYGLKNPIEVQVEVTISAAGRVTHANLVSEAGPYAAMLGPSALDAAWQWTFQPATLGGKPVESRIIVRFRYSHKN